MNLEHPGNNLATAGVPCSDQHCTEQQVKGHTILYACFAENPAMLHHKHC